MNSCIVFTFFRIQVLLQSLQLCYNIRCHKWEHCPKELEKPEIKKDKTATLCPIWSTEQVNINTNTYTYLIFILSRTIHSAGDILISLRGLAQTCLMATCWVWQWVTEWAILQLNMSQMFSEQKNHTIDLLAPFPVSFYIFSHAHMPIFSITLLKILGNLPHIEITSAVTRHFYFNISLLNPGRHTQINGVANCG